ncbi:MAG: hypothetical protein AABX17_00530 [Nanoarchaeota archaeon]
MTNEGLTTIVNSEAKCMFKINLEKYRASDGKVGTSFLGRTPANLKCYACEGTAAYARMNGLNCHTELQGEGA